MKAEVILVHKDQVEGVISMLEEAAEIGPHVLIIKKHTTKRTLKQNASLHKYTSILAEKMNDAGITQKELIGQFKDGFELPVSGYMIKDIFRAVGLAMFKKESTADLDTVEIQKVYQVVDQRFSEVTGVRAEWPSRFGGEE